MLLHLKRFSINTKAKRAENNLQFDVYQENCSLYRKLGKSKTFWKERYIFNFKVKLQKSGKDLF